MSVVGLQGRTILIPTVGRIVHVHASNNDMRPCIVTGCDDYGMLHGCVFQPEPLPVYGVRHELDPNIGEWCWRWPEGTREAADSEVKKG